jgi:RNA polymerase sigma factor (sigma-70 family)
MNGEETSIGGQARQFPSTCTSLLKQIQDPAQRDVAFQKLMALYWKPVYCLIRRSWGKSNEEAKDLTQEFFATMVLGKELLSKFDGERGRFRSFLKASVVNFLRDAAKSAGRLKRGGGFSVSMAVFEMSEMVPDPDSLSPEEVFDEAWRNLVLSQAVQRVEDRLKEQGKALYFEVFKRYDIHPTGPEVSYKLVGDALGLKPDTVKNYLTAARALLRQAVEEVVAEYVDDPGDVVGEIQELFGG